MPPPGTTTGVGGTAAGSYAIIDTTGAGQTITFNPGSDLPDRRAGQRRHGVQGGGGGNAIGGEARLQANGGAITVNTTLLSLSASATGGTDDYGNGGNATGGTVKLGVKNSGTLNADLTTDASAAATGGTGAGSGGNALGGLIGIKLGNNAYNFDKLNSVVALDASATGGPSESSGPTGTAGSQGGALVDDTGTANLAGTIVLNSNTALYVQAGGALNVPGYISGAGPGAYLHLWADDTGTGTGTVTLANNALSMGSNQIDIYYNPVSLGTPTSFSSGISAGTITGISWSITLPNCSRSAATSRRTSRWARTSTPARRGNTGAGFVPIGSNGTPFTGNFDGLNHTITNLFINQPATYEMVCLPLLTAPPTPPRYHENQEYRAGRCEHYRL